IDVVKRIVFHRNLFALETSGDVRSLYAVVGQIRKRLAARAWIAICRSLRSSVLAVSFAALLSPVMAHARNYEVINAEVPFKFNVGKRSFHPGQYQLIVAGPGLLYMRDSHSHVIASLMTRSRETDSPAPETKLIFNTDKKHLQFAGIRMANRSQVLDVL